MNHHQRGVMAHVQGDVKGALAAFTSAIETKPDFAYAYYRMGFVLEEQRKRRLDQGKPPPPPADDALPVFQAALRIDPSDEMAHFALGQALQDRARPAIVKTNASIHIFNGFLQPRFFSDATECR